MQTKTNCTDKTIVHQCLYCAKAFKYESDRRRHENSHNPQFSCNICLKKFSFLSALNRHKKQHDRSKRVECDKCWKTFKDDILLQRHYDYAHKGTHLCKQCKSIFCSSLALKNHMKVHKTEDRKYVCSFSGCDKTFYSAHHLKHHELNHTNTKQLYCDECGKGFIQRSHLKSHIMMHRPEEWLPCLIEGCKKMFPTDYARKRHLETHKKKEDSDPKAALSDRQKTLKESRQRINPSKQNKRKHKEVLKVKDTGSNIHVTISNYDFNNTYSEKQFQSDCLGGIQKIDYEEPSMEFEYNNVIEIIRADNDATKEKLNNNNVEVEDKEIVENTPDASTTDITVLSKIGKQVKITTINDFETKNYIFSENIGSIFDLQSTQNTMHKLKSNQDSIYELASQQGEIVAVAATQDAADEHTLTQNAIFESASELKSSRIATNLDPVKGTDSRKDKFTATQTKIDESTSTQNICELSTLSAVDDFRCGDCDCTSIKLKDLDFINNINDQIELPLCKKVMPNLEHREDGALKLTDTFEFDSFPDDDDVIDKGDEGNLNHTCKVIFGNCIVSGNSNIGDNCICAKISKCEHAQEIEDITPCPGT